MDVRRLEAKGLARAKARSRRLREARIRKGTIRGSLALFAVLWTVIFVQLVSGNDPALSKVPKGSGKAASATADRKRHHPRPEPVEAVVPSEPAPEEEFASEPEAAPEAEFEAEEVAPEEVETVEPEVEFEEPAPDPEPAPEPVVTSSS